MSLEDASSALLRLDADKFSLETLKTLKLNCPSEDEVSESVFSLYFRLR
jgi:hypothetical protein